MKRIIAYAPNELGGMNIPSIETIQDQKGIQLVVRQLQWGKEVATDLKILISIAQLEAGTLEPILDPKGLYVPYLEPGHISHLHGRLCELNGGIDIEGHWTPSLQRIGDQSIMEACIKDKAIPNEVNSDILTNVGNTSEL